MHPAEKEKQCFFDFADFKPSDIIWDFGCGDGRYIFPVKKVYATDIGKGTPPYEQVDKFILLNVLHYNKVEFKKIILKLAYLILKSGGHIVIIEPNPYNPFFYCLYFWRWLTNSKCKRRWHNERFMSDRYELKEFLLNSGFKNIHVKKYAWFPSKFKWLKLNEWLNEIPILCLFNAFNWIKAEK